MADAKEKKWILLINKSPRGPFIESEVKELLAKKVVRPNDVAYLVKEGAKTEWKLLWQFPEFDRRREKHDKPPVSKAFSEKRKEESEKKAEETKKEQIPIEMVEIDPGDLLYRSAQKERPAELNRAREEAEEEIPEVAPPTSSSGGSKIPMVLGLVGFLILGYVGVSQLLKSPFANKQKVQKARTITSQKKRPPRRSASPLTKIQPKKRERVAPPPPPRRTAPPPSREPDRGFVAEPDNRDEEDDEDEYEDEEEEEPRRKNRRRRNKASDADEEDDYEDDEGDYEDDQDGDYEEGDDGEDEGPEDRPIEPYTSFTK